MKAGSLLSVLLGLSLIVSGCGGGSSTTADTTAPTTTAGPTVTGTTDTATTLSVTINEDGTGYYLVQAAASAVPAVAAVQAASSVAMTANVAATPAISGLTFNTPYKIYFVAKDAANNVQTTVQNTTFTTLPTTTTNYVTQGGLTWMPIGTTKYLWTDANTYCTSTTINGVSGWRLPTQPELSALYTAGTSSLSAAGWVLASTWSSSFDATYTSNHDLVALNNNGQVYSGTTPPDVGAYNISCVR
jgi:hypothetical protein